MQELCFTTRAAWRRWLETTLAKHKQARAFFAQLAPSHQKQSILWISVAKRNETKARRVRESIALLVRGEKPGMK